MTDLIKAENNLPTNLEQLTVEIKFYVNQWGQNTIEIGQAVNCGEKNCRSRRLAELVE